MAAVAAVTLAGCTGKAAGPTWSHDEALPCPKVDEWSSGQGAISGVESVAQLPYASRLGTVKLWAHYLSYTTGGTQIVVCDLARGHSTVVAGGDAGHSPAFDYAVGTGDTVVYGTLSAVPDIDTGAPVDWRLWTFDLRSGRRREVARATVTYEHVPRPVVAGRWAAWTQESQSGTAIVAYDLRSRRTRTVVSAEHKPHNVGVGEQGLLVFDGEEAGGKRDIFTVPADGSASPRRVTDQGDVQTLSVLNGRIAWRSGPSSGAQVRWTMPVDAPEVPTQVPVSGRVVPGPDFLVAEERRTDAALIRLSVQDVGRPSARWMLTQGDEGVDVGSYWDVNGDLVAWVGLEAPAGAPISRRLHLTRVVRSP